MSPSKAGSTGLPSTHQTEMSSPNESGAYDELAVYLKKRRRREGGRAGDRVGEFGTPDRTTLLAEISTWESQVLAL